MVVVFMRIRSDLHHQLAADRTSVNLLADGLAPLGSELVAATRQLRRAVCIGGSQGRSSPVRISAPPTA
jgi:hypothetical protein